MILKHISHIATILATSASLVLLGWPQPPQRNAQ
jgi:hypothetical protein